MSCSAKSEFVYDREALTKLKYTRTTMTVAPSNKLQQGKGPSASRHRSALESRCKSSTSSGTNSSNDRDPLDRESRHSPVKSTLSAKSSLDRPLTLHSLLSGGLRLQSTTVGQRYQRRGSKCPSMFRETGFEEAQTALLSLPEEPLSTN